MTALDNTPTNKNFLSPLNFKFSMKRAPHVNFFIQRINIPSIELPEIAIPNMFVPIPNHTTRMKFGEFYIEFKVDEDFQNYMEIHSWLRSLGSPINFEEYRKINAVPEITGEGKVSDLSLIILNSVKMPNYEFTFKDAFPSYLSQLEFDTTRTDVEFISARATFYYTWYDIERL